MLGQAKRVTIDKDNTVIVDGAGDADAIKGRTEADPAQIETPPATMTVKSSRNVWPSWPAALP
jgi:hypothetical protein